MKKIVAILFLLLMAPASIFAQGLSELNLEDFDRREDVTKDITSKNPFAPSQTSPDDLMIEDLFLNGIVIIDGGARYALINGNILSPGDSIAGLRVKMITAKKVVLQELDKIYTLYLEGGL